MIKTDQIRSLTDFRQNARAHLDRLAETRGIEVLTVNGEARGVVMAPETFDALAELASRAQITESIRAGLAEVSAGLGDEARDALRRIASEKGIPFDR